MVHGKSPEELRGVFEGGAVRAVWRLSGAGESEVIREPAALRTTAGTCSMGADQRFLSDLPGALMDSLDVTAGTAGGMDR